MNLKYLALALALALALPALEAATPTVTVTLSDFTTDFSGAGYVVRITPATGGTAARALTDSDGVASFATVTPGIYALSLEGVGVPTLQIRVPNTADTTAASTIVISNWTPPGTGTITSGIWENESGTIQPASGQSRNTLSFTSGLADAADNIALLLDTAVPWDADDEEKLLLMRHAGTNVAYFTQWGSLESGKGIVDYWAPDKSDVFVGGHTASLGESETSYFHIFANDYSSDAPTNQAYLTYTGNSTSGTSTLVGYSAVGTNNSNFAASLTPTTASASLAIRGTDRTRLDPTVTSSGSAIAYTFDTSNQLTNSDRVISFLNLGVEQAAIFPTGAIAAGSTNRWKTGIVTTGATVALTLTNYVNITINGVAYKLGLVQ